MYEMNKAEQLRKEIIEDLKKEGKTEEEIAEISTAFGL
jgi:hypothetical protein